MAKPHERVFALIAALLFLVSSIAVSIFVILQLREESKIKRAAEEAGTSQQAQQTTNQTNQSTQEKKMLEGSKLENFTPIQTVDKLQAQDVVVGTGDEVKPGATVTAHYTGAYAVNGTIFQSSHDGPNQPIEFSLNGVIPGWTQGVPGMKVGGKRRLIIPGSLAYGEAPAGYTPGSTERPMGPLIFDIEITAVKNP